MKTGQLIGAVLMGLVLVGSTSSCAVAARLLMAAEVIDTVNDLAENYTDNPRPTARTSGAPTATVAGTRGDGLRLNARPGQGRMFTVPDGTSVAVLCDVLGPEITGWAGTTSTWTYARTSDGNTGFMSNAFLDIDLGGATVPRC